VDDVLIVIFKLLESFSKSFLSSREYHYQHMKKVC